MARDTRTQFLDEAEALFAQRGFYGVSIAAIGDAMGLTKQALLHHFDSKEKLYGEVLKRISESFDGVVEKAAAGTDDPRARLRAFLLQLYTASGDRPSQTQLLMRELLDNRRRADTAGTWYLKRFLEHLIAMVQAIPNWQDASDAEALSFAYQMIGAINYFQISQPTLTGIFGSAAYTALEQAYRGQLERLIDAGIAAR
ncbi:MAG: TetR/AcrR family transcriptional regulator [Pseudomonadota bacterium]